ncbi:MAG: hypothetical protein ACUZ8O_15985 [Candidatus Anammoxibacter sp.]
MAFPLIVERIKKLELKEIRDDSSDYFEFVIHKNYIEQLNSILESCFGLPLKPAGQKPSRQTTKLTASSGGVRLDQTLHHLESETETCCAIQWPWGDGEFITVKITCCQVLDRKTDSSGTRNSFLGSLFGRKKK